jgi:AcrR family transcriptional regulator
MTQLSQHTGASRTKSKRSAKRDAILDIGADTINLEGAGGIRIGKIAETLGLSRNALYYYFRDRSELIHQCFLQSCDTIEDNLNFVSKHDGSPQEKLVLFIRRSLLPDHPHRATLADTAILDERQRDQILSRQRNHVACIDEILKDGQKLNDFRAFDTLIVAHAILGMLDWVVLWAAWVAKDRDDLQRKLNQYTDALIECVLNGFLGKNALSFTCRYEYEKITRTEVNLFDRADINRLRRQQLIEAASTVFNRKGIHGSSVDAIGEEVGASKGAVYHYFEDKTKLIEGCYEHAFSIYEWISKLAHDADVNHAEMLLIDFHLNCQAQASLASPLILQPGLMRLPPQYLVRSKSLAKQMSLTFIEGQKTGHISAGSPYKVEVTPGAFFWIQKWKDAELDITAMRLADELTNFIGAGILADDVAELSA